MFRVTATLLAASSPAPACFSAALRLSIVPTLVFARPPHLRWFSTFSRSFLGERISTLRPRIPSPYPIRLSGFLALQARAVGSSPTREIMVRHVLVKEGDSELFADLQKRILDEEDMSDLTDEYSICPSKKEGGLLGWVKFGSVGMVPEFEEAAFKAELNHVVRCKPQFGWHLLQVLSEREPVKDIQVEELHSKMQDPVFMDEAQLVDVREPDEIEQQKGQVITPFLLQYTSSSFPSNPWASIPLLFTSVGPCLCAYTGTESVDAWPHTYHTRAKASLPGFQVFPLRQFETWAPEITSKLNPEKDTFVMCKAGGRSLQVANWLQSQGFKSVYTVGGGIQAYSLKVDPLIPTY